MASPLTSPRTPVRRPNKLNGRKNDLLLMSPLTPTVSSTDRSRSTSTQSQMASMMNALPQHQEQSLQSSASPMQFSKRKDHRSILFPLDMDLQIQAKKYLGDGPMRYGPVVLPPPIHLRQQLRTGDNLQLNAYVRLRAMTDMKKKKRIRKATDEQILRTIQFSAFQNAMAYSLLKSSRQYYFYLTAADRQRDIQENLLVVPLPKLQLLHAQRSRVLYFKPARFMPRYESKSRVIDSFIYILDNWTKYDATVWTKQDFSISKKPVSYCLMVHLDEFQASANYSKDYWAKLMALIQGRVFPVNIDLVLWVDVPPSFEKVWHKMTNSFFLTTTFAKRNIRLSRYDLGDYLAPDYANWLPSDEFPDIYQNEQLTLDDLAKDYILFQKYIEALEGKGGEPHKSLKKRRKRSGSSGSGASNNNGRGRRFSMPHKFRFRRRKKKEKDGSVVDEQSAGGDSVSQSQGAEEDFGFNPYAPTASNRKRRGGKRAARRFTEGNIKSIKNNVDVMSGTNGAIVQDGEEDESEFSSSQAGSSFRSILTGTSEQSPKPQASPFERRKGFRNHFTRKAHQQMPTSHLVDAPDSNRRQDDQTSSPNPRTRRSTLSVLQETQEKSVTLRNANLSHRVEGESAPSTSELDQSFQGSMLSPNSMIQSPSRVTHTGLVVSDTSSRNSNYNTSGDTSAYESSASTMNNCTAGPIGFKEDIDSDNDDEHDDENWDDFLSAMRKTIANKGSKDPNTPKRNRPAGKSSRRASTSHALFPVNAPPLLSPRGHSNRGERRLSEAFVKNSPMLQNLSPKPSSPSPLELAESANHDLTFFLAQLEEKKKRTRKLKSETENT